MEWQDLGRNRVSTTINLKIEKGRTERIILEVMWVKVTGVDCIVLLGSSGGVAGLRHRPM